MPILLISANACSPVKPATTPATGTARSSEVERYVKSSGLLTEKKDLFRLDVMQEDADEARLIEGIKNLISE